MKKIISIAVAIVLIAASLLALDGATQTASTNPAPTAGSKLSTAIFAGGCFWCVEADFEKLPGVIKAESGYIGGHVANPTYVQVSAHTTGHAEAVRITFDPAKVSYEQLLNHFWHNIDPTVKDRQFCDIGTPYRTGIYYLDEAQHAAAEASKAAIEKPGMLRVGLAVRVDSKSYPGEFQLEANRNADADAEAEAKAQFEAKGSYPGKVFTEIVPATTFYPAEEYHQDYYKKNPIRYKLYRTQCGRDARLKQLWGDNAGR